MYLKIHLTPSTPVPRPNTSTGLTPDKVQDALTAFTTMSSEGKGQSADVKWKLNPTPAVSSHATSTATSTEAGGVRAWLNHARSEMVTNYKNHWAGRLVGQVQASTRHGTY